MLYKQTDMHHIQTHYLFIKIEDVHDHYTRASSSLSTQFARNNTGDLTCLQNGIPKHNL